MAVSVALTPGRTIRWRKRRFVVVDRTGFDAIIAREVGKSRLARIPVSEVRPDHTTDRRGGSADLVSVDSGILAPLETDFGGVVLSTTTKRRLRQRIVLPGLKATDTAITFLEYA